MRDLQGYLETVVRTNLIFDQQICTQIRSRKMQLQQGVSCVNLKATVNVLSSIPLAIRLTNFLSREDLELLPKLATCPPPTNSQQKVSVAKSRRTLVTHMMGDRKLNLCHPKHKYSLKQQLLRPTGNKKRRVLSYKFRIVRDKVTRILKPLL